MAKYSYPVDFEGTFWTIIDGDFYVSTVGNDVTGDGSPKNPFLTIHRAFELAVDGEKIVIGPDEYIRVDGTTTGVNTSGSEVPCRVATTGNISLVSGGLFTIDGVLTQAGDRVLVWNQDDPTENGIFIVSANPWERADDFNNPDNIIPGKLIPILEGSQHGNEVFQLTTSGEIVVGTTPLSFKNVTGSILSEVTYQELASLKANNQLTSGNLYKITDHVTTHQIPNTTDINIGISEPLVVKAIDTSALDYRAYSLLHPKDVIHYDFDDNLCEDGATLRTGKIVYREDTIKAIKAHYDWRNVKFRRWMITGIDAAVSTQDTASSYSATIVYGAVDATPTRYREYYIEFPNTAHNANPTLALTKGANTVTKPMVDTAGTALIANALQSIPFAVVYYSPSKDAYVVKERSLENNAVQGYLSIVDTNFSTGNGLGLKVNAADFADYLTFVDADPGITNMVLGKKDDGSYNNIIWQSTNRVAHTTIGSNGADSTFKNGDTYSLFVRDDFQNNIVIGDFRWSRIGNEFQNNLLYSVGRIGLQTKTNIDGWAQNNTFFCTANSYLFVLGSGAYNNTIRLDVSGHTTQYNYFENIDHCFFNWAGKISGNNLMGQVTNKAWEDGANWEGVNYHRGSDVAVESFTQPLQNTTVGDTLQLNNDIPVSSILDEDDMASNSISALPTQKSVKAYVDTQVLAGQVNVVDNLLSTAANEALSANQGRELKALIDGLVSVSRSVPTFADLPTDGKDQENIFVEDASGDSTVTSGWAIYKSIGDQPGGSYVKIAEQEGLDIDLSQFWKVTGTTTIQNGSPSQITVEDISAGLAILDKSNNVGLNILSHDTLNGGVVIGSGYEVAMFFDPNNVFGGGGGFYVEDLRTLPKGIEYKSDYSSNYTLRSLVDKAYVDAQVANVGAAGNNAEIQFNDNGSLGATDNFTFSPATGGGTLAVGPSSGLRLSLSRISNVASFSINEETSGTLALRISNDGGDYGAIYMYGGGALRIRFTTQGIFSFIDTGYPFGIGTSSPNSQTVLSLGGNSSITLPKGTTAERPSTPVASMLRFNTDTNQLEVYDGTQWVSPGGAASVEERVMFDSNLDTSRTVYYNGVISFGNFSFDNATDGLVSLEFQTSTDGSTWTSHGTITAPGAPPAALNTWVTSNGSGNWYLRLVATYKAGASKITGTQWTFTR